MKKTIIFQTLSNDWSGSPLYYSDMPGDNSGEYVKFKDYLNLQQENDNLMAWYVNANESWKFFEERCETLEKELMEQARLNGIGSEREAKLLARIVELERKLDIANHNLNNIS